MPGFPRPGASDYKPGVSKVPAWLDYCAQAGLDPLSPDLTDEYAALWYRMMEAKGLSQATIARKLSAVSSWYTWLIRRKVMKANPLEHLDRPNIDPDTSKTPGLTREQAMAMIAAADNSMSPQAVRNAALVAMLIYTGARASEICGATVDDLGIDRGHRVLLVSRKGKPDKEGLVMPPPAVARLDAYLSARTGPAVPARASERSAAAPLFTTGTGRALRTAEAWEIVRRVARAAGLPAELVRHLGAHAMRHAYATLSLDAGASLRDLQDAMGHKDPRTTRRYDRARRKPERSPGYKLAEYLSDGGDV